MDTTTEGGGVTLTGFLLARIAEDENWARRAEDPMTPLYDWFDRARVDEDFGPADPSRVLAECEAKRRIVEIHALDPDPEPDENWAGLCTICDSTQEGYPCATLRALAAAHADHPDYRQEWRP